MSKQRKYNSIWQVLNARNDVEGKYHVLEALVDGLLQPESTGKEVVKECNHLPGCKCPLEAPPIPEKLEANGSYSLNRLRDEHNRVVDYIHYLSKLKDNNK